jgi:hypothetical protein
LPRHVNAIQIGHLIVEQNQVRGRFQYLVQGFRAGPCLSAYMPRLLLFQNRSQISPHRRIVID